jgi:DNA-binding MarR family transcriptional regulator
MDDAGEARAGGEGSCAGALAGDLGWGLGVLFRAYATRAAQAVADLPGGPRGYQVLSAAAQSKVGTQLALAQHLGVDRTVMTYLLDDLEQAGLIERRPDPEDRRARRIVPTPAGVRLLVTLDRRLRAVEDGLLAPLDDESRRQFRDHLRGLATHIDAADPVHDPGRLVDHLDDEVPAPRPPRRAASRPARPRSPAQPSQR